jgi:hypothetical protein
VKARRVWDESYVAAVSPVSHVCSSESTFSIIPTLAPHTECHVGMKNIADSISQTYWEEIMEAIIASVK